MVVVIRHAQILQTVEAGDVQGGSAPAPRQEGGTGPQLGVSFGGAGMDTPHESRSKLLMQSLVAV